MIFIAEYLFKHEIMDREQFELCFEPNVTEEMLDAVIDRKKKAAEAENEQRRKELDDAKKDSVVHSDDNVAPANDAFSEDIVGH